MSVGLLALALAGPSVARETVRVAFHDFYGYGYRGENGVRTGYAVEWIERLALRFDWNVEWVDVAYGDSAAALGSGAVDLSPFVMSPEREHDAFEYTRLPIGISRMSLFVPRDSIFDSDELAKMDGIVVGTMVRNVMKDRLAETFASRGVKCVFREFATEPELEAAFRAGRVGAALGELTDGFRDVRKILRLPSTPFFIAVSKSRPDLLGRIDEGLAEIMAGEPELVPSLRSKHFRNEAELTVIFNSEERSWIERQRRMNRAFTVDLSPVDGYVKIYDEHGGVYGGFAGRILSEVADLTGLVFRPLKPRDHDEAGRAFEAGEIDVRIPYGCPKCEAEGTVDASRTLTIQVPQAVVTRRFSGVDVTDGRSTVAVVRSDAARIATYDRLGLGDRVVYCQTAEEAVEAVVRGRIDCFPGDYPLVNRLVRKLNDPLMAEVRIFERSRHDSGMHVQIGPKVDRELVTVLSKAFALLGRERLVDFENDAEAMERDDGRIGVRRLMRYGGVTLLAVFAVVIVLLLRYDARMRELLRKSRESLEIAQEAIDDAAVARAEMRDALEKAEYAAKSKSNFLATMSHEIRTPLNAVVGFSEFLTAPDITSEKVVEYARGISLSAHALLSLINDILDLSKFESGSTEGLDVRNGTTSVGGLFSEMDSVFRARAEGKGVTLSFEGGASLPPLVLAESRLRQILLNLVGNAVKFTDRGEIAVTAGYADGIFRLTVRDTGIGISPRAIGQIFDPFVQDIESRGGKVYAGTGLGLAIAKRLVEASDGRIWVESVIGKGSVFTVEIPRVAVAQVRPPAPVSSAPALHELMHVVIVDDVAMNRQVLKMHCRRLGIEDARVFDSGFQVVDYLKDPANPCDVVLTDVWMPGMDGAELAARCVELRPELPVIAVTADAEAGTTFDMSRFRGVLTKPVTGDKLSRLLAGLRA